MRLHRLSLRNWRGTVARDIVFAAGVTLIEGPNEIGKSTLVEALRLLFGELDSSNKRSVKAIQPAGEDVGSRVEAEIEAGPYRFVYAKTYNRNRETTLHLLAPQVRQESGREAHEYVERLLGETVDIALWAALLVDQGEKVGLARLEDSASLTRALDEAAGESADALTPDAASSLYAAAAAEYELYFTPKTRKPKFLGLKDAVDAAEQALADARTRLADVERYADEHARQAAEVQRLRTELPRLESRRDEYRTQADGLRHIRERLEVATRALGDAESLYDAVRRESDERTEQLGAIDADAARLADVQARHAPLEAELAQLRADVIEAEATLAARVANRQAARRILESAGADAHLLDVEARVARIEQQLRTLAAITTELAAKHAEAGALLVDDAALAQFRAATEALNLARARRDAAATAVSITAYRDLEISVDGTAVTLQADQRETHTVATTLAIDVPGLASLRVVPSTSAATLADETTHAQDALARLTTEYGAADLEAAMTMHQQRADAYAAIARLRDREQQLLDGATEGALRQALDDLGSERARAATHRLALQGPDTRAPPPSKAAAAELLSEAAADVSAAERAQEAAQDRLDALRQARDASDSRLRNELQERAGLENILRTRQANLTRARTQCDDAALLLRLEERAAALQTQRAVVEALDAELRDGDPERIRQLLDNAVAALSRAVTEQRDAEQALAVLSDRLEQARADGRFDTVEQAERTLEDALAAWDATQARAAAAERLWNTLNAHRDAARRGYVLPLKDTIERLGRIVFGADFAVEVAEDWSIVARTLDGRTLPFEDLSVGAREQIGILVRLAAAQLVSRQGGVPLILDDALGFSDPTRLETMGAAIAAAGDACQVILLTCTPGRFTHVGNATVVRLP